MTTSILRPRLTAGVWHGWRDVGLTAAWLALAIGSVFAAPTNPSPDGLWVDISPADIPVSGPILLDAPSGSFRICRLDPDALTRILSRTPFESTRPVRDSGIDMTLPMPNGEYALFRVVESPVLAPRLQVEHPELRTYVAQGIDDPTATARLDWTPLGFHAMVLSVEGTVVVGPYRRDDVLHYTSFYKRDLQRGPGDFRCYFKGSGQLLDDGLLPSIEVPSGSTLRTYRLAMTATGEYTQYFGGIAQAQAAITTTVNRVNGIYERELAVRLSLVAFNIYADPNTDPFPSPITVNGTLLTQNQNDLNTKVGQANYDIGHLVNAGDGGGLAAFGVCDNSQKGRAATSITVPVGDAFDVDYVAHEMGHQFHGDHTFNGTTGACGGGNREAASAYEPGSGSTIMAYAGICGAEDLQPHSDPYFHTRSFDQIVTFREGAGTCGPSTSTGNTPPVVDAGPDVTIPRGTPFTLTAQGSDVDSDALTYCWEEFDLGAATPPPNMASGPLFRSFDPTSSSSRTFPRLQDVLSGTTSPWERLPSVDRTMRFRCTVRDNRAGGGGVNYDDMVVTVSGEPFSVTFPNGGETVTGGCPLTVSWNVGGGSSASTVDILYSSNGGSSFTALATDTSNDGSEIVDLPCGGTVQGRIEVRAVGSVFFDVSDADFGVTSGIAPTVLASITGGPVDATCQRLVTYSGTVTDDCGVDASSVSVTLSVPSANATLGTPSTNKVQSDARTVTVAGSVIVSQLLGPATVRVTIGASDHCGNAASNSADAEVIDTTPPEIAVILDRDVLWPPNHRMSDIAASVTVTDACDPAPTFVLTSITSSEPDNEQGDGNFVNDIQGASYGSRDTEFQLRSERQGTQEGRTYTIVYTGSDISGNTKCDTVIVRVPHDQSGHALAAVGFQPAGDGFVPGAERYELVITSDPGFDATLIEPRDAYVGNALGTIRPRSWMLRDVDGDRDPDLELTYEVGVTTDLLSRSDEPLGLHYETSSADYAVSDIFALGTPIRVPGIDATRPPGTGRDAGGETIAGDPVVPKSAGVVPGEPVVVDIYSVLGRKVGSMVLAEIPAAGSALHWDGTDGSGKRLPSGVYFCRPRGRDAAASRKVILVH